MSFEQAKFTLEIDMGNDAMSSLEDVAGALLRVSARMSGPEGWDVGNVFDLTGNNVGSWAVR